MRYRCRAGLLAIAFFVYFLKMMLPVALTAIIAGIAGNIIQNKGFLFSTKPLEPKFSKILPKFGEYFRKTLFSAEGLFNVAKSIIKVAIIVVAAYVLIKGNIKTLLRYSFPIRKRSTCMKRVCKCLMM